jgi:hypothetical protein
MPHDSSCPVMDSCGSDSSADKLRRLVREPGKSAHRLPIEQVNGRRVYKRLRCHSRIQQPGFAGCQGLSSTKRIWQRPGLGGLSSAHSDLVCFRGSRCTRVRECKKVQGRGGCVWRQNPLPMSTPMERVMWHNWSAHADTQHQFAASRRVLCAVGLQR